MHMMATTSTDVSDVEDRLKKKRRKKKNKSPVLQDLLFINEDDTKLPTCTSKWSIFALESVGVYYDKKFLPVSDVLDMVYDKTGMFGPLSPEKKDFVKSIQEQLMFSFSIIDVMMGHYNHCIEETMKGLKGNMKIRSTSLMQDFATSTVMLILHARHRKSTGSPGRVSEDVFVDLFKTFVKMCGLIPSRGEDYRSNIDILQTNITSTADVVILAEDFFLLPPMASPAISVVSIVQVNNMTGNVSKEKHDTGHVKTKPSSHSDSSKYSETSFVSDGTGSSEQDPHEEPAIYNYVLKKILAQHGAELFVHGTNLVYGEKFDCKRKKCRLYPGMIVIGTQVMLTVLEYPLEHLKKLLFHPGVLEKGKSYIHYSEPKDLLKKEDRDLLIESLVRLSNGIK